MSWNGDEDLIMLEEMIAEGVMHQNPEVGGGSMAEGCRQA